MTFRFLLSLALLAVITVPAGAQLTWNQAASFDGTASYLTVPSSPELNLTGSFTIEFWMKPATNTVQTLMQKRVGTNAEGYTVYINSSRRIAIRTQEITMLAASDTVVPGVWTHVACRYDAGIPEFAIFFNGVFDTSHSFPHPPTASADSLRIGAGLNGAYTGVMDEVRIWNRALPQSEIVQNERTSLGASGGVYAGLVLALTFQDDDSYGPDFSLSDYSGNGNDADNRGVTAVDMTGMPPAYLALNSAVDLDGSGDFLSGRDNVAVSPTEGITLEAWILPRTYSSSVIIQKGLAGAATNYRLRFNGGQLGAGINGNTSFTANAGIVPLDVWTHVAFTYAGATGVYAFYVNGTLTNTATNAQGNINDGSDSLYIGGSPDLACFNGLIDEVRISHRIKTAEEIRQFVYVAIDDANEPNSAETNVCYNLDGVATDQCGDGGPRLLFNGDARFSSPATVPNVGVSPLGRVDQTGFLSGFTMKSPGKRIPETTSVGAMIPDSIFLEQNTTISDLNLFVGLNHTWRSDIDLTLTSPGGVSVDVCSDWGLLGADDNIVTLFDDNADSSFASGRMTSPGPHIRPEHPLNAAFSGTSTHGWWVLHIADDASPDTGRLYVWGIQINNQAVVTHTEESEEPPFEYRLAQNYPNPFNPVTTIEYTVPAGGPVTLEIYDLLGRRVATLVNEEKAPGNYHTVFDARGVASGTYFYRLTARDFVQVRRMLLLR